MKLAIIGPSGSGKTTQSQTISQLLVSYMRVSTGEMIRSHIRAGTEMGRRVEQRYNQGEYVPDEEVLELIKPRLQPAGFWILDGFPRTVSQARALDEHLEGRRGGPITRVISLEGPSEDELVRRITSGRRHSEATGMVYHAEHNPPPAASRNLDPGPFIRREDDGERAIRNQISAYRKEADALKEHYESRGLLSVVNADLPIQEVTGEILDLLDHPENPKQSA
ncbi:MAG: nucleoside monophosphate kinase [Rubrobacter sp.]|nr:nucleoside monophosphate kinase [Rubrobacter sp.]